MKNNLNALKRKKKEIQISRKNEERRLGIKNKKEIKKTI